MGSGFGSCYGLKRKTQHQFVIALYLALITPHLALSVHLWALNTRGSSTNWSGLCCRQPGARAWCV